MDFAKGVFEIVGSIVLLAGLGLIIYHASGTAQVINAAGGQFTNAISTATFQGGGANSLAMPSPLNLTGFGG